MAPRTGLRFFPRSDLRPDVSGSEVAASAGTAAAQLTVTNLAPLGSQAAAESGIAALIASGGGSPFANEPGWTRLAEHSGDSVPGSNPLGTASGLAGMWYSDPGHPQLFSADDSTFGVTDPYSGPKVWQSRYPAGQVVGNGNILVKGWDASGLGSGRNTYAKMYMGFVFNLWGNGTDFEMSAGNPTSLVKILGYIGYGQATNTTPNQGYWLLSCPYGNATGGNLNFRQQSNVARSVPGAASIRMPGWYVLEARFELNSAPGVADGILRQWIRPFGGTPVLFCNRADMEYQTAGNTAGFNCWHWNAIYGGSGGNAKTRADSLLLSHVLITGAP